MENLRKRTNIKLITSEKKFIKIASKPTYKGCNIISENFVIAETITPILTLNKPCYIGMSILDLSKTLMYDFHYNYIKSNYGDKAILLATDTDSLKYEIETNDIYEDFYKDKDLFDNSDYSKDSKYFFNDNKKVIGKFKDEAAGVPIIETVGLRSKMYSDQYESGYVSKKCKGIKKQVVKQDIKHQNYKDTLFKGIRMRHKMNVIRSKNHEITTQEIDKISLSCGDDKSYIWDDGINRYAHGHWRIEAERN